MSEHLRIPTYRNRTNGAVSYGDPTHWQHPEDWEPVHVLTYDDLARIRAEVAEQIAAACEREAATWATEKHPDMRNVGVKEGLQDAAHTARQATP